MNHKDILVLATRNKGKIAEFRKLLAGFPVQIKGMDDFEQIGPINEDGKTFQENAVKKAVTVARITGMPALSDDSGLVVPALNGMPGVLSARFAGEGATDRDNNLKLLLEMEGITNREAGFACVIVIAVPQGDFLTFEGTCHGLIAKEMTGSKGFGYDPVFYYPPLKKTFAQISTQDKNKISHRGKAMNRLKSEFDQILAWIRKKY